MRRLAILLGLMLCAAGPTVAASHQIYVWNRAWSPAVRGALAQFSDVADGWRVLAAETGAGGTLRPVAVDWKALAATHRPIIAVVRIDGTLSLQDARHQADRIRQLAHGWPAPLAGLEIDYDCGTARLHNYALFLAELRRGLSYRLSITALPAWLKAPALDDVIAGTDEIVLQVHAVRAPSLGLFDPALARGWVDTLSARDAKPFRVALPDYGTRVVQDDSGKVIAVESEMPRLIGGISASELLAAPDEVARFVRSVTVHPPKGLAGLVWFRLPVEGDVRAWSPSTLKAVMRGEAAHGQIAVVKQPGAFAGALDVALQNDSETDLPLPAALALAPACRLADGVNGYALKTTGANNLFVRLQNGLLRAHHRQVVGWMRCDGKPSEIQIRP